MGIVKEKIERHLIKAGDRNEIQAGFTEKRGINDNLYILRHCVQESFEMKRKLYVVSLDYKKKEPLIQWTEQA